MQTCVFDIETNAIKNFQTLDGLKTVHCLVIQTYEDDLEIDSRVQTFSSQEGNIEEGLRILQLADAIVGHNIINFDIPALQRLFPWWKPEGAVWDTLVMSRVMWPDIRNNEKYNRTVDPKLWGSHSLKAWGQRLHSAKGDYGEEDGCWDSWTQEMEDYCVQDVGITNKLYSHINSNNKNRNWDECFYLEHEFAECLQKQQARGFYFDDDAAEKLYIKLRSELLRIEAELQEVFPPKEETMKTREYWITDDSSQYRTKKEAVEAGYKGILLRPGPFRVKKTPFNPGSRVMIAAALKEKYDWKPVEFTQDGRAKVDESVLNSLDYPEAALLSTYLMLTKRIGQLGDGKESWLKLSRFGWIHGQVNGNGTVTGRCTHSRPNVAQVPSVSAPWGRECRELFTVPNTDDWTLVGADASGLELRMLAHYMARYDNGAYANIILNGDIHETNRQAAGLTTRDDSKRFIYAYLYGAGDAKIADVVGSTIKGARKLKSQFLDATPALRKLKSALDVRWSIDEHLTGLDGRRIPIRSRHSMLNTLLQSAGAVVMKKATCLMCARFMQAEETSGTQMVAHVHDEVQLQCRKPVADVVGDIAVTSIKDAGKHFNLRCPLDGEYKHGKTWADTH